MTARDTEVMQAAGNLHHPIRNALFGQTQDILHNPTPLHARNHVLDHHTRTGENLIEHPIANAYGLVSGLFLGCLVCTPAGS